MQKNELYKKALNREDLTTDEGLFLYTQCATTELAYIANELRLESRKPEHKNKVGWIIDRNVNITNICAAQCKFCNFCRHKTDSDAYITTIEEYKQKIDTMYKQGGRQLLLQGGLHPALGIEYYCELFSSLKSMYPDLKLHALGPAEIAYISRRSKLNNKQVLELLKKAGLDSLPGAGAEILTDRVRSIISPAKCSAKEWLDVMHIAHSLYLPTSATMMFGTIETMQERIEHLIKLRDIQKLKPTDGEGFITFIPWPFQDKGTKLQTEFNNMRKIYADEYIRTIAVSRIMLNNINNIQASWLTVGKEIAQVCLYAGANDFGSIMIEENVVSAAGARNKFDANGIQAAIKEAGFIPCQRNQKYEFLSDL